MLNPLKFVCRLLVKAGVPPMLRKWAAATENTMDDVVALAIAGAIESLAG